MDRASEAGVRVLLTGQGGDEVLYAGEDYLLDLLGSFKMRRLGRELRSFNRARWRSLYGAWAERLLPDLAKDILSRLGGGAVPSWVDRRFIKSTALGELIKTVTTPRKHRSGYLQTQYELVQSRGKWAWVLWSNLAAPQHNVELRHPFLDSRLVEFLLRIPPEQKLFRGATKAILRRAMRGVLPESIRLRGWKTSFLPLFDRGMGEREMALLARLLFGAV